MLNKDMHSDRLIFLLQGVNLIQQKVAPPAEKSGNESPIISFILLERIRLVQTVHQSLAAVSKVIRGTQLLSKDIQNLAAALLNQEVSLFFNDKIINQIKLLMVTLLSLADRWRGYCFGIVHPSICPFHSI